MNNVEAIRDKRAGWNCKPPKVNIGVCTCDISTALRCGFDYLEPAASEIAAMTEDRFRDYLTEIRSSPIRCKVVNGLIRQPELAVVGRRVDKGRVREYLEFALGRCHLLGAEIAVWGSAGSRNIPVGMRKCEAWRQIANFLEMVGDIARHLSMVIAIEPLCRQESNILNTGSESLSMVRTLEHPNVKMMIDYFHLRQEGEPVNIMEQASREIVHLHFADPRGRIWPTEAAPECGYESFFRCLKRIGYLGGISIEARGPCREHAPATLRLLRRLLA